jgi:hypothetical protein
MEPEQQPDQQIGNTPSAQQHEEGMQERKEGSGLLDVFRTFWAV